MGQEERRNHIMEILRERSVPVSGAELSKRLNVSRQVIVQDMAIIRANGMDILATNRGYLLQTEEKVQRVFKVQHGDDQIEQELLDIVDMGGRVKDVFVYHKVYGVIRAELDLKSRLDIKNYMAQIQAGTSTPLKNVTGGYHYHTVTAEQESILDHVQEKLEEDGFLAPLQEYEPVDFS